jgi:hypothetical protein
MIRKIENLSRRDASQKHFISWYLTVIIVIVRVRTTTESARATKYGMPALARVFVINVTEL